MSGINVYCRDFGWLFEDLKEAIAAVAEDVVASNDPLPDADSWICIRTNEARTPVAGWFPEQWAPRTVVQVHDFYTRSPLIRYGAVSLVHPDQRKTCPTADKVHVQPIGARRLFTLRDSMPAQFTVGFVGRDVTHHGRHIKRPQLFVDAVLEARRQGCEVKALWYDAGDTLAPYFQELDDWNENLSEDKYRGGDQRWAGDNTVEGLEQFYHSIDALVVTCEPEPGPLSVYEALACGVPVIGTRESGALAAMADAGCPGAILWDEGPLANAICAVGRGRMLQHSFFEERAQIRTSVTHWQDDWAAAQVELARGLC